MFGDLSLEPTFPGFPRLWRDFGPLFDRARNERNEPRAWDRAARYNKSTRLFHGPTPNVMSGFTGHTNSGLPPTSARIV
jgi:hypothetical protein